MPDDLLQCREVQCFPGSAGRLTLPDGIRQCLLELLRAKQARVQCPHQPQAFELCRSDCLLPLRGSTIGQWVDQMAALRKSGIDIGDRVVSTHRNNGVRSGYIADKIPAKALDGH